MAKIEKIVTSDWEPTANRFVAFFDIMGFKDLVLKQSHEDILNLLKILSESQEKLKTANNMVSKNGRKVGETKSFTFSDSIIFFSKSDGIHDLNKIILDCVFILKKALEHQIPIKGAISFGKITLDEEKYIYFGQPIIDAYLLHEDLHLYTVIADNSFEKRIQELDSTSLRNFEFYKTPLKSGKSNHYLLKPLTSERTTTLENLKKLYITVSGKPRQYIDNTIDFINSLESQKKT